SRKLAHRDDRFHRARPVFVAAGVQQRAEHSTVNVQHFHIALALEELGGVAAQHRTQQYRSANHVIRIRGILLAIWTEDVYVALQTAYEVRALRFAKLLLAHVLAERFHTFAYAAREDEDRAANWVADLALLKLAVLHRCEKVAQPAESLMI